jgi:hypothetical protein
MNLPVASYTFLNTWSICNHQAARKYIIKDLPKEPESPEMKYGNDVHNAMEKRLDPTAPHPLVDRFAQYEPFAAALDGRGVVPEMKLGITAQGAAVGFWDSSVWLRGKLDAPIVGQQSAVLLDWKTGKVREDPYELEIQALLLQAKHPEIKMIVGRYVWLKENRLGEPHDCSDTATTWKRVHKTMDDVAHAIKMETFEKTPGALCGWCPVMDCKHNRKPK